MSESARNGANLGQKGGVAALCGSMRLHLGPQLWGHLGLSLVNREEPPWALVLAQGWPGSCGSCSAGPACLEALNGQASFVGEQLAPGPLCGAVGKSPGQPLTVSQKPGLSLSL